jgi:hypothetical protein
MHTPWLPYARAAAQVDIERLSQQLRHAGAKQARTNTYDALVEREAWVDWGDFVQRAHAFIADTQNAQHTELMAAWEVAMLCGDAALLSLSGAHTPHHRAGQLETLVVVPNKGDIRCIYEFVRAHAPAPRWWCPLETGVPPHNST